MGRRRTQPPEEKGQPRLTVSRAQADAELADRIQLGEQLFERANEVQTSDELEAARADYYTWNDYNTTLLKQRFTTTEVAEGYSYWGIASIGPQSPAEELRDLIDDIRKKIRRLESVRERLPLYEETSPAPMLETRHEATTGSTIFVVHGHDDAVKLAVHGFLREITPLNPVVLHDMANRGRTIIEKFEDHAADAAFAVIILTADDIGGTKDSAFEELQSRARQNVVFEHGFFTAALGRSRVAVLHEEDVELPSDIDGVLYIPIDDAGGWKLLLAREIKAASIEVRTDKLL